MEAKQAVNSFSRFTTQTGNVWLAELTLGDDRIVKGLGETKEQARQAALRAPNKLDYLKSSVVNKYRNANKNPMLVVGANIWQRKQLPEFILKGYDVFILFYPNNAPGWVIGAVAIPIQWNGEAVWSYGASLNAEDAAKQALQGLIPLLHETKPVEGKAKLMDWLKLWVYRCAKIALKDVLALEPYSQDALDSHNFTLHSDKTGGKGLFRLIKGGKSESEFFD